MKRFKRLSFVLSVALFASVITFSSCKKDKDDSEAIRIKAAEQFCNCMTEMEGIVDEEDMAGAECALNFYNKYGKYFNFDLDSDLESLENMDDINNLFTDADFGKAFIAELLKCQLGLETE